MPSNDPLLDHGDALVTCLDLPRQFLQGGTGQFRDILVIQSGDQR